MEIRSILGHFFFKKNNNMHQKSTSGNKLKTISCIFFLVLGIDFTANVQPSV